MAFLQKLWGELDHDVFKFYWTRFKLVDDEQFKNATSKLIDTFRPTSSEKFPSPSRFVELLGADEETCINLAIGAIKKAGSTQGPYQSVSFGDRALHAAIMRFGGWPSVSCWDDKEWKFREKSFIQTYKAEMHSKMGPVKLMGLSEEDYELKCFDMPEEKRIAFKKSIETKTINWTGYQTLIENKNREILKIADETSKLFDMDR